MVWEVKKVEAMNIVSVLGIEDDIGIEGLLDMGMSIVARRVRGGAGDDGGGDCDSDSEGCFEDQNW